MQLITTHDIADFDGVAAMLAAHKLYPDAVPVLPPRLGRGVREFITLYQNGLPFVAWRDFRPQRMERIILVDTQKVPDIKRVRRDAPVLIIDHHPQHPNERTDTTFTGDIVGAATTLLVEQIRTQGDITLNGLEATLLLLGIYSDTGALTYGTTTARDAYAAGWLLSQGAAVDTVRGFLAPSLNDVQRDLLDMLINVEETRTVQGYAVTVGAVTLKHYVENINSVAHRLRDLLDPDALFILVQMPDHNKRANVQMVCRSRTDSIDCGAVARHFGGGGHSRAAAANIDSALDDVKFSLWDFLVANVQPAVCVADLMSHGAQTVRAEAKLGEIITQLRKIGHEGYPVLDGHAVVGLLTRRDADRALEHGLKDATVRDVMTDGEIVLSPSDSVATLERLIVDSGWGQIPVMDAGRLVGIVTRTDLIKHWATVHPPTQAPSQRLPLTEISAVLGTDSSTLIETVAAFARERGLNLYMVGGIVRDVLLRRHNDDIDFVLEGDARTDNILENGAIQFAQALCAALGGKVSSYRPFGTATWLLDEVVAEKIGADLSQLPPYVDFATARNEFYVRPTALPSVYGGSIKLDLHRRDFTINTLAVQLSPTSDYRLLDFYGGLRDLNERKIRALHSLSFVDDPTRVLRAARFEHRLQFEIEPRTAQLIERAHPMLRRITGERLRNELKLLLNEAEPERALHLLEERGILNGIHPALRFPPEVGQAFIDARTTRNTWPIQPEKTRHIYWVLMMAALHPDELPAIAERLRFSQTFIKSFVDAAHLRLQPGALAEKSAPVSAIVARLDGVRDLALLAAWITGDKLRQTRLSRYIAEWAHIRPTIDGNGLKAMGLTPGPRFGLILSRLRSAWLDGEIADMTEEAAMLNRLIEETKP